MEKETKQIEDILKNWVATNSGFRTPKNYFSQIEEKVEEKIATSQFSKIEGYLVPDNYFESLESKILSNVEEPKNKVISLRTRVNKWVPAVAAAIIVCLLTFNFIFTNKATISEDELVAWFENDIEDLTQTDLLVVFENIDLNTISLTDYLETNTVENYLENQDITYLLEELN